MLLLLTITLGLSHAAERAVAAPTSLPREWSPVISLRPWSNIVLHHSATAGGDVAAIDAEHRKRKDAQGRPWLGIAYHFVIGNGQGMADGRIEPTFRWWRQIDGAHAGTAAHNANSIGICLMGDFSSQAPTREQLLAARRLVAALGQRFEFNRADVLEHRAIRATECPGRAFSLADVLADFPVSPASADASRGAVR